MGLAETQTALARLYTDAAWRKEFFADPLRVGAEAGLTGTEASQLARMQAADVNFFAHTLHGKRLNEIRKLLPLSCRAFGPIINDYFRVFAETYLPDGVKKHRDDALAFAAFLREKDAPDWAGDVLRYETARLMAAQPRRCLLIRRFRYALKPLLRELATPETEPQPSLCANLGVWFRLQPTGVLRHWLRR